MEALVLKPFKASLDQSLNDALTPRFQRWQILQWMRRNTIYTSLECFILEITR